GGSGEPGLLGLSYIRECARLESNQRPLPSQSSALPLSYERVEQSLRQESNPHLGRTKGACLPLTLRRQVVPAPSGAGTGHWAKPTGRCSGSSTPASRA